jgi:hypothetical protein
VALETAYLFGVTPLVTGEGTVSFRGEEHRRRRHPVRLHRGRHDQHAPQLQVTC